MDCACLVHEICGNYNKGVYVRLIRSTTKNIFDGGNTLPHENLYIRKINLQKTQESQKFNEENLWITRKSYKFQEQIALPFFLEKNVGKPLIYVEDLR